MPPLRKAKEVLSHDLQLAEAMSSFYADPLGFVKFAYPWGEPGILEAESGPDDNQVEFLSSLGQAVRRAYLGGNPVLDQALYYLALVRDPGGWYLSPPIWRHVESKLSDVERRKCAILCRPTRPN